MMQRTDKISASELASRGMDSDCFKCCLDQVLEGLERELASLTAALGVLKGKALDMPPEELMLGAHWIAAHANDPHFKKPPAQPAAEILQTTVGPVAIIDDEGAKG